MRLGFLFPGQGAQSVGMGASLAEGHPLAREVFEAADATLGYPLSRMCWYGPAEELRQTVHTQPALLTHSVAALRLLESAEIRPERVAGHSLGEYSACVAAGAIGFEDALRLVQRRGELMHRAGIERPGTMAAILGLERDQVEAACAEAASVGIVRPANFNAPGQIAISGEIPAVERACELAKAKGAKRAIRLEVSGAFHSPLMESAARELAERIDAVPVRNASCPIVCNVRAEPVTTAAAIREALKTQLLGAVLWEDSMRAMMSAGVEAFVELGSGKVLRGLLRTLNRDAQAWNVEDSESLNATLGALGSHLASEGTA